MPNSVSKIAKSMLSNVDYRFIWVATQYAPALRCRRPLDKGPFPNPLLVSIGFSFLHIATILLYKSLETLTLSLLSLPAPFKHKIRQLRQRYFWPSLTHQFPIDLRIHSRLRRMLVL